MRLYELIANHIGPKMTLIICFNKKFIKLFVNIKYY